MNTSTLAISGSRSLTRFTLVRIVLAVLATCLPVAAVLILAHQIPDKAMRALWPQLLAAAAGVAGYVFYVQRIERRAVHELSRAGGWRELGAGMALGALLLSAIVGVLALLGAYRVDGIGAAGVLPKVLAEMALVALVEEIVFRGVLLRVAQPALGAWGALLLSSLLFALAHLPNEGITVLAVANTFVAGLLFGAAWLLTRRLWLAAGFHFAWNFLSDAVFSIPTSGHPAEGLLQGRLRGPDWLSGGAYGVEASLVTLLALGATTIVLLTLARRRKPAAAL